MTIHLSALNIIFLLNIHPNLHLHTYTHSVTEASHRVDSDCTKAVRLYAVKKRPEISHGHKNRKFTEI